MHPGLALSRALHCLLSLVRGVLEKLVPSSWAHGPPGPRVCSPRGAQLGGPELSEATEPASLAGSSQHWCGRGGGGGVGFSGFSCGPTPHLAALWTTAGCLPPWPGKPPLAAPDWPRRHREPWVVCGETGGGAGPGRGWCAGRSQPFRVLPHHRTLRQMGGWWRGQWQESESISQMRKLSQESAHSAVQVPGVQPQPGMCPSDLGQLLPADPPQLPPGHQGTQSGAILGAAPSGGSRAPSPLSDPEAA